jgi:hypothetical protein
VHTFAPTVHPVVKTVHPFASTILPIVNTVHPIENTLLSFAFTVLPTPDTAGIYTAAEKDSVTTNKKQVND